MIYNDGNEDDDDGDEDDTARFNWTVCDALLEFVFV